MEVRMCQSVVQALLEKVKEHNSRITKMTLPLDSESNFILPNIYGTEIQGIVKYDSNLMESVITIKNIK